MIALYHDLRSENYNRNIVTLIKKITSLQDVGPLKPANELIFFKTD